MKTPVVGIAIILFTSACASAPKYQDYPQTPVKQKMAFSYSGSFDKSRIAKVEPKVVRSLVENPDKSIREVAGANCTISSPEMSIKVTTPTEILLPVIKEEPKPLQVSCSYENLRSKFEMPAFIPVSQTTPTYQGGGIAGILVSAIVYSAADSIVNSSKTAADLWRYRQQAFPEVLVPLK